MNKNIIYLLALALLGHINTITCKRHSDDIYCVILAGGTGERLWPLSRKDKPKQFLSLDEQKTLLETTVDRLEGVSGTKHVWVVTTKELVPLVKKTMKDKVEHIVAENAPRNTGPAILATLLEIAKINEKAYVIFLPADHYIPNGAHFAQDLSTAIKYTDDTITLLGIKPTFPATGYGYIQYDPKNAASGKPVKALGFFEKPSLEVAKKYLDSGTMLWNAGIFCGKASSFIREYKAHAPELYDMMQEFIKGSVSYDKLPNISIDYAILEKSKHIAVLPVQFEWSDVGNLSIYLDIRALHTKPSHSVIEIGGKNNIAQSKKKVVAFVDVEDLCLIETDDVILVVPRAKAERVKAVVEQLKKEEHHTKYV
jgi:mannose-1-phosphate guanylyltransferase/mannose-6-phosphate isomerase